MSDKTIFESTRDTRIASYNGEGGGIHRTWRPSRDERERERGERNEGEVGFGPLPSLPFPSFTLEIFKAFDAVGGCGVPLFLEELGGKDDVTEAITQLEEQDVVRSCVIEGKRVVWCVSRQIPPSSCGNETCEEAIAEEITRLETELRELTRRAQEEQDHIRLLHRYNETKDAAQAALGKLAEIEGVCVRDLYERFGLNLND